MGCGPSKEPATTPKSIQGNKSNVSQRQKSSHNSPARRSIASKHDADDRNGHRNRRPPKGLRRLSGASRKVSGVPVEARYYSPVPYEPEDLVLEGNWELEKGIDVSWFVYR